MNTMPTYEQLPAEVEQLRKENEQLRQRLGMQPKHTKVAMAQLSRQEKIELFQSLFAGRSNVFLADKDEFCRDVVGLYPIRENNTVSFFVLTSMTNRASMAIKMMYLHT